MSGGKLASLLSATAALGCGAEQPVPDAPTWAQDVQPILRANCFHCHGPTASFRLYRTLRWDVYDLGEEPYQRMGFEKVFEDVVGAAQPTKMATFFGANDSSHSGVITAYVNPEAGPTRMPPPPATPLTERDRAVLQRWSDLLKQGAVPGAVLKGSHQPNRPPSMRWLQQPSLAIVRDDDGDQVLGRLDCTGGEVRIEHSGAVPFAENTKPPCRGTLYDGYEEATVSLE